MKKKYILFILVFSCFKSNCQVTNIPDPAFESKLISIGLDTGSIDGFIATASIDTITILDLSFSAITDLSGIESFSSLTSLNVRQNELDTLNLEHNILVEHLDCSLNPLKHFDITENTQLLTLDCGQSEIVALDVSNNLNLISIKADDCYENITGIDLSNLSQLVHFSCNYMGLTTLDITENLLLEHLNCRSNNLTELDLTNNTNLKHLDFNSNYISSIDLSNNVLLTELWFRDNQMTDLDLANNTSLKVLMGSTNLINEIDLSHNTNLWYIDLEKCSLNSLNLSENEILEQLNVAGNNIQTLDLTQNGILNKVNIQYTPINFLNIQNGNNYAISEVWTSGADSLDCILVDDPDWCMENWLALNGRICSLDCSSDTIPVYDPPFDFTLYPNPSMDGSFRIKYDFTVDSLIIKIYNINSQIIKEETLETDLVEFKPAAGVYFVHLTNTEGTTIRKLIVN